MNLRKDPEGVIKALTTVEGDDWLKRQKDGQFKGYSVFDAIEELKMQDARADFGVAIIYGDGGWNRYRVTGAGEVQFLERQAWGPEATKKAEAAGFEIF